MYRFHSIGETPLKIKDKDGENHWYTIMVGINPTLEKNSLHDLEQGTFDLFIMNRNPKEGMYIEDASLEQVANFLNFAKRNPLTTIGLYDNHKESGITEKAVSLDQVIEENKLILPEFLPNFQLFPSFEPFVLPTYVSSETEFRNKQISDRVQPYVQLCKALNVEVGDLNDECDRWINRNASFARLAYIIEDGNYFKPLNFCPKDNHYWDWLQSKKGVLFLRTVYITTKEPSSNHILPKEEHPPEYAKIPEAVCPTHNVPLRLENGFHVGEIPVSNEAGIHMRPSQSIVKNTERYKGDVFISYNGHRANAKQIMDLTKLAALRGAILKVEFEDVKDPNLLSSVYCHLYRTATTELR